MNTRNLSPLFAICLSVLPNVTAANGTDTHPHIDSDLSFSFRLTTLGEEKTRGTRTIAKFDVVRFGVREVMTLLAELQGNEGAEGRPTTPQKFPGGSRLVAARSGEVFVSNRSGERIFDASPYITFSFDRPNGVTSGTEDPARGQLQSTDLARGTLSISLPSEGSEGEEADLITHYVNTFGLLNERYSRRTNVRTGRTQETESIAGNLGGDGSIEGHFGNATGSVRLNGRLTTQEL